MPPASTIAPFAQAAPPAASANYQLKSLKLRSVELVVGHWPGTGPNVVLVHGLSANHRHWQSLVPALQAAGCNIFALDLRGRGWSSKPFSDYGLSVHARDIAELLEALQLDDVCLMGHSLGASIALTTAAKHPMRIRSLVLIDGGAVLKYSQGYRALQAIKPSLKRLGRVYPSAEAYLEERRMSPMVKRWTDVIEDVARYELEKVGGGVRCVVPKHVIEQELRQQGGSLSTGQLLRQWTLHYRTTRKRVKGARALPYHAIRQPSLILAAGTYNLQPGDELLPQEALETMLHRLPDATARQVPHTDHYSILLEPSEQRDKWVAGFMNKFHG